MKVNLLVFIFTYHNKLKNF